MQPALRAVLGLAAVTVVGALGCGSTSHRPHAAPEPTPTTSSRGTGCPEVPPWMTSDGGAIPCACEDEVSCVARCEAGLGSDCDAVSGCYWLGMGGYARDVGKFVRYAKRGCDLGNPSACRNLGEAFRTGSGVDRDPTAAAVLFRRAFPGFQNGCAEGNRDDCYMLGHSYERGEGVAPDRRQADRWYGRACALGHGFTCARLGMDADEAEKPKDALRWFALGCENTCLFGCAQIGERARAGVLEAMRITDAWHEQCESGSHDACRRWKDAKTQLRETTPSPP